MATSRFCQASALPSYGLAPGNAPLLAVLDKMPMSFRFSKNARPLHPAPKTAQ
jgi:hypothetical protein